MLAAPSLLHAGERAEKTVAKNPFELGFRRVSGVFVHFWPFWTHASAVGLAEFHVWPLATLMFFHANFVWMRLAPHKKIWTCFWANVWYVLLWIWVFVHKKFATVSIGELSDAQVILMMRNFLLVFSRLFIWQVTSPTLLSCCCWTPWDFGTGELVTRVVTLQFVCFAWQCVNR